MAAPVILSTEKKPTQIVPNTPLKRCTGHRTNRIVELRACRSSFTAQTTMSPPNTPMMSDAVTVTKAHDAVMATQAGEASVDRHAEVGLACPTSS